MINLRFLHKDALQRLSGLSWAHVWPSWGTLGGTFGGLGAFRWLPEILKLLFLDGVGCCIHGNTLEWTKTLEEVVTNKEDYNQCSIIGTNKKTTLLNAVLINSTAGHGFESDDIHRESILHPNSIIVPVSILAWISVTYLTKPEPHQTLRKFYEKIQPGGWWSPVRDNFKHTLEPVSNGIFVHWISGIMMIYGFTFGIGNFIFNQYSNSVLLFGFAFVGSYLIWNRSISKLN